MSKKTFEAIVRHYHCADRQAGYEKRGVDHPPYSYSGLLKEPTDLGGSVKEAIMDYLSTLPDGEFVEITIKGKGKAPTAKGFVWAWIEPNTYGRIQESDYRKMVELEKSGEYEKIPFKKYDVHLSDVVDKSTVSDGEKTK